ncbi:MAG: 4Fe-4S dicluster domain-containing protein [Bacteroidetes bacterium]|nr:4Fe-4S dicluster domain-containing protein [Bacteroidota bacterium]
MSQERESLVGLLKQDVLYQEAVHACINCGTCTAICPAARFYDYDPRRLISDIQNVNEQELVEILKSDIIWYCGQCLSCKTRCPRNNVPGFLITALRSLSQDKGYFAASNEGNKQLTVKRIVGENIIKYGYCVFIDEIGTENHPEQGPVWEWYRNNADSILKKLGANYKGEGPGTLRRISKEDLDELYNILKETKALDRFDNIERYCND